MSGALGADALFELKLIFLRELAGGYASARAAYDGLGAAAGSDERPLDRAAVDVLHRLAGTAASVDLPLLGRLSAACESACDALLAGSLRPGRTPSPCSPRASPRGCW